MREATCTTEGILRQVCANCNDVKDTVIDVKPDAHIYGTEYVIDKPATCTEEGAKSYHCIYCDTKKDSNVIPKLEHVKNELPTVDKAPTCEESGSKSYHCTVCDAIIEDTVTILDPLGHQYDDGTVALAPTCSKDGILVKKCSICKKEVTETIPKTDIHVYPDEWTVLKAETCTSNGLKVKACQNCSNLTSETIPATGHSYTIPGSVEPAEDTDGREYLECDICHDQKTTKVLVKTAEAEKISAAEETVTEGLILNDENIKTALDAVTQIDNQSLIDSQTANAVGEEVTLGVVETLENKLVDPDNGIEGSSKIAQTQIDSTGDISEGVSVKGAAVTVADIVQDENSKVVNDPDKTYAAQLSINESTDPYEPVNGNMPSYTVDIKLDIVDTATNQVVEPNVKLSAPIQITMPIPEAFKDVEFELYHIVDGERVLVNYIKNANGTITFNAPSLSPWSFEQKASTCNHEGNTNATWTVASKEDWEETSYSACVKHMYLQCSICGGIADEKTLTEHGEYTKTQTKEATCTEKGTYTYTCPNCGDSYTEDIPCISHTFGSWEVSSTNPPTCESDGEEIRTCSVCEFTETRSAAKLNHVYSNDFTVDKEATCKEAGSKSRHCLREGCTSKTDITEIPKSIIHDMEEDEEKSIPATCLTAGLEVKRCRVCGKEESTVIPRLSDKDAHTWGNDYTTDKEPTCTASGEESIHCTLCGVSDPKTVQEIPKTTHSDDGGTITTNPTCTEDGVKTFTCTVCEQTVKTEPVSKLGHDFASTFTIDTPATCTAKGSKSRHCSRCEAVTEVTDIPALGHKMVTVVDKAATCGAAGTQHQHCTVCDADEKATSIPATGKHSYGSYVVTKSPTALAAGIETRTCKVCGRQDSRSVAKLAGTIKLTVTKLPLQLKKSVSLNQVVTGLAAGDYIASWKSSNAKIASVSTSGKVTGKKAGKAVVTVTLASGKSANITVTVQKAAVKTTKISGLLKKITLKRGGKATLKPVITPITSLEKVTYTTSNKKVATVRSKGVVVAKASGTAKITVKSGSKKFIVTVVVQKTPPTKISGIPAAKTLKKGKTLTLKPKLLPSGSEATVTYKSSNTKVATVTSKGKITANKAGKATITVKAGSVTAQCVITVK